MGHTNDEESDFEGFELKDIVKDEESGVDLNNENILCQFDFFLFWFFSLVCVWHYNQEMRLFFAQQCLKDISSNGWNMDENWIVIMCFLKYVSWAELLPF